MVETLDQIFVTLKHQAVGFFPDAWHPLVSALISISFIPLVFATLFAFVFLGERLDGAQVAGGLMILAGVGVLRAGEAWAGGALTSGSR